MGLAKHSRLIRQRQWTPLLSFAVAATIAVAREFLLNENYGTSVWAEDGWVPLCVVDSGHFACLDVPVNGYWPIIHRLVAEPLAFLPLASWPFLFPALGALSISVFCGLVYQSVSRLTPHFFALLGSLGILLVPVLGVEFLNVLGNVHWILLMSAMVLVALREANSLFQWPISTFLFVASLSNPAGFVIPAMIMLIWLARRTRFASVVRPLVFSTIGWLIQVAAIVRFGGVDRVGTSSTVAEKLESWASTIVGVIPGASVSREGTPTFLFVSSRFTPVLVVLLSLGLVALVFFGKGFKETQRRFALLGIGSQGLTAFLVVILDENPRYTFVLVALNLIWIVGLIGSTLAVTPVLKAVLVCLLLVAPLAGFKAGSYRTTPSEIGWQDQLDSAKELCDNGASTVELFFAPSRTYVTELNCDRL